MSKLWTPRAPAIITRRKLLTGAVVLGAYAALGADPALAASSYAILGTAHGQASGSGPASVTVNTTGADWFAIVCHGTSGGVTPSQQYTDNKNAIVSNSGLLTDPSVGGYPNGGVSLSWNSVGFAAYASLAFNVGATHTFTAGGNSFNSGIEVIWGTGSYTSANPINGDVTHNGANTGATVTSLLSPSITPSYDGSLVLIASMMNGTVGTGTVSITTSGWTMDQGSNGNTGSGQVGGIMGHLIQGAAAAASATTQFNADVGYIFNVIASFRPASYAGSSNTNMLQVF